MRLLPLAAMLAILAGCAAPPRRATSTMDDAADPFAHPGVVFRFAAGADASWTVDDRTVLTLRVEQGRLVLNGRDSGPYRDGTPVRFLSRDECLVGGECRAIPAP